MIKLANAFSIQMFNTDKLNVLIHFKEISREEVIELLADGFENFIGHDDLTAVLSNELNMNIQVNRQSLSFNISDILIISQVIGGRLFIGTTQLPENFSIKYIKVVYDNTNI